MCTVVSIKSYETWSAAKSENLFDPFRQKHNAYYVVGNEFQYFSLWNLIKNVFNSGLKYRKSVRQIYEF